MLGNVPWTHPCLHALTGVRLERCNISLSVPTHLQMEELARSKLEPPKRLADLAARHWSELEAGTLVWDRPAAETAALRRLALPDLQAFYEVG